MERGIVLAPRLVLRHSERSRSDPPPAESSTPLTLNTTVASTISIADEIDSSTFTGAVGQKVLIDTLNIDLNQLDWRLLTPSGALLDQRYYEGQGDDSDILILPEPGTYTQVFDGDDVQTPGYSFRVLDVATAALPLVLDTTVNGTIDPGSESAFYQFTGLHLLQDCIQVRRVLASIRRPLCQLGPQRGQNQLQP